MKDSKSILLLIVSVLLILVSCALLWTWGYNFNNFTNEKQKPAPAYVVKDSAATSNKTRDSLQKIYTATINNFGTLDSTWTKADSLKSDLDLKLSEFYKLRNEIAAILKNPAKKEDLDIARQKIGELQKKIDQLRNTNSDVEQENQRLSAMLQQLTGNSNSAVQSTMPAANEISQAVFKNNAVVSNLVASDLRLTALMVDEGREQETYQALQTDKFVGSFTVKNNYSPINNTEIMVVLLQPDNKVLQASSWESGRFDTRQGKKIYSCKVKFDYSKGENKRLSFSLNADNVQKGTYIVQLYFNGNLIGKISKTLI